MTGEVETQDGRLERGHSQASPRSTRLKWRVTRFDVGSRASSSPTVSNDEATLRDDEIQSRREGHLEPVARRTAVIWRHVFSARAPSRTAAAFLHLFASARFLTRLEDSGHSINTCRIGSSIAIHLYSMSSLRVGRILITVCIVLACIVLWATHCFYFLSKYARHDDKMSIQRSAYIPRPFSRYSLF